MEESLRSFELYLGYPSAATAGAVAIEKDATAVNYSKDKATGSVVYANWANAKGLVASTDPMSGKVTTKTSGTLFGFVVSVPDGGLSADDVKQFSILEGATVNGVFKQTALFTDSDGTPAAQINNAVGITRAVASISPATASVTVEGGTSGAKTVSVTAKSGAGSDIAYSRLDWSVTAFSDGNGGTTIPTGEKAITFAAGDGNATTISAPAKAPAGTYTIQAAAKSSESATLSGSATVTLTVAHSTPVAAAIESVTGEASIAVPDVDEGSAVYTGYAVSGVKDQFDQPMTSGYTVVWSIAPKTGTGEHVSVNQTTGAITVEKGAMADDVFTLTATIGTSVTQTLDITLAALQVQAISYDTASMDKNYGDAVFTNTLTQTTVPDSPEISYTSSNTAVATVNSSTGEVTIVGVGTTTITATSAKKGTYAKKTASYTLTVKSKELQSSDLELVTTNANKGYDGNVTANVTAQVKSTSLVKTGDSVTVNGSAAYDSADIGTSKTITFTTTATPAGATGTTTTDLYYIPAGLTLTTTGNITAKQVTVSIADIDNVEFNGSEQKPELTVTYTENGTPVTLTAGSDYTVTYTNNTNAGTATATIAAKAGGNYTFASGSTLSKNFTITKKAVTPTLSWAPAPDLTYDGSAKTPKPTVMCTSSLTETTDYTFKYTNNTAAGDNATVTIEPVTTSNYTFTSPTHVTFTIKKASLTVPTKSADLDFNKNEQTVTLTDFDGDKMTVSGNKGTNVGDYTATVSLKDAANYEWSGGTTENKTIAWKIKAVDYSGATLSAAATVPTGGTTGRTFSIGSLGLGSDFVDAKMENLSASGTITATSLNLATDGQSFTYDTPAATEDTTGTITFDLTSKNYNKIEGIVLTLTAKNVTFTNWNASWVKSTATYGATNAQIANLPTGTFTGADGDSNPLTGVIELESTADTIQTAGARTIQLRFKVTAPAGSPYIGATVASDPYPVTISPRTVALSWSTTKEFDYDTTPKAVSAEISNLVSGDTVTLTYTGESATNAGEYTAEVTGLSDSANYALPTDGSQQLAWKIKKAPLTVTGVSGVTGKTYDGTTTAAGTLSYTFDGLLGSDSVTITGTTFEWTSAKAGTDTVKLSGMTLADTAPSSNYQLTKTSMDSVSAGGAKIAKADRTLTATPSALTIVGEGKTGEVNVTVSDDKDNSAKVTTTFKDYNDTSKVASATDQSVIGVKQEGKKFTFTALKEGQVAILFEVAATDNYNAATASAVGADITKITSTTELLAGVTVTPSGSDTLSYSIDHSTKKIIVSGLVSDAANTFTVVPTVAAGLTVDPTTSGDVKKGDKVSFAVKDAGGNKLATYELDTTGVTVAEGNTTVVASADVPDGEDIAPVDGVGGIDYSNATVKGAITIANGGFDLDKNDTTGSSEPGITNTAASQIAAAAKAAKTESTDAVTVDMEVKVEPPKSIGTETIGSTPSKVLTFTISVILKITNTTKATPTTEKELHTLDSALTFTVPIPTGFTPNFARHDLGGGKYEYFNLTLGKTGGQDTASWKQKTFSKVDLIADARTATVDFGGTTRVLTAADIGKALPASSNGWTLGGASGATTLTDKMLTNLSSATGTVKATATSAPSTVDTTTSTPTGGGGWWSQPVTPTVFNVNNTTKRSEHGTISFSDTKLTQGKTVTITVTPDKGYQLDKLTVTDAKGNSIKVRENKDGTYSFTMPGSEVKVNATFVPEKDNPVTPENPETEKQFIDVPEDAFFAKAVAWAVKNGITNGTSEITFSPDAPCTRAQVVTFLYRAAGEPEVELTNAFVDVNGNEFYAKAVAWAVANGITNGKGSADTFKPDDVCTRAEVVTFLARFEKASLTDVSTQFVDVPETEWFAGAVAWAVANGITSGTSDTTFAPNDVCTRGQVVTFLYRDFANK